MRIIKLWSLVQSVIVVALVMPISLRAQSLTSADFQKLGAEELIGKVTAVKLSVSTQYYEEGTVEVNVEKLIAGSYSEKTISLPFQRNIRLADQLANWDLIGQRGESLKGQEGLNVLVYFTVNNGVVSLCQADNSVQPANSGLILGWIRRTPGDRGHITIDVNETVFGFVNDNIVTLPVEFVDNREDRLIGDETLDEIALYCHDKDNDHQVLVYYVNGKVMNIKKANSSILAEIKEMDALVN